MSLDCEICGEKDPPVLVILQVRNGDSYITLACQNCAYKSPHYCGKHDQAHIGYPDGSTVCEACVAEEVRKHHRPGGVSELLAPLAGEDFRETEAFEYLCEFIFPDLEPGDPLPSLAMIRLLVTKATRNRQPVEGLVSMLAQTGSANLLYG